MKNDLLFQLKTSEIEALKLVISLDVSDLQKSKPNGWSIGLQLQHILDIEQLVFESAQTTNIEIDLSNKSEQINHIMLVSERKFKAPEQFQPTNEISSISDFLSSFKVLRTEIYAYIENNSLDLMSEDSHPLFGNLSQHDWFIFLDTHSKRHLKQIQTILETFNQI